MFYFLSDITESSGATKKEFEASHVLGSPSTLRQAGMSLQLDLSTRHVD